jgi:large subunit ribosomal protein L4
VTPIPLLNADGVTVGRAALAAAIADQPIKQHVIHETVVAELAARRAGTHSTLTSRGVRRAPAAPARAPTARRTGPAAASSSAPPRAATAAR